MPHTRTTVNGARRPHLRIDHHVRTEQLEKTISDLKKQLARSRASLAQLFSRLERNSALTTDRATSASSAAAFIDAHPALTPREREVLLAFLAQPNDKQIALRLGTKVQTVRNQLSTIQPKLNVSSRAELAVLLLSQREL